jgi:hypothetical protein
MIKFHRLLFALLGIGLLCSFAMASQRIKLRGDNIMYRENHKELVASSNASLVLKDMTVRGQYFVLNTTTNILRGEGDIYIEKEGQDIYSDAFTMDLNANTLELDAMDMTLTPFDTTHNIYVKAEAMEDKDGITTGKKGWVSTCEYDPPHYYMAADNFIYEPNKHLIGQNVNLHNPVFGVPLGFWTPAYIFDLGKRQVVYLMPVMGTNNSEGTFFKSTFDYYFGSDKYGKVYVDFLSFRGIGLGAKHHYGLGDNTEGSIYQYGVSGQQDRISEWDQTVALSDIWDFQSTLKSRDMYLINGGRTQGDSNLFELRKDDLGDKDLIQYKSNQNSVLDSRNRSQSMIYQHDSNDRKEWFFKFDQTETSRVDETYTLNQNHRIAHDFDVENNVFLQRNSLVADPDTFDEALRTTTTLRKKIDEWGTSTTELSLFFDIDDDRVTQDVTTYVQKLPESSFHFNPIKWNNITFQETITVGNYEEAFLQPTTGTIRNFRAQRYLFNQSASTRFEKLPLNSALSLRFGYDQFIYSTGDENYKTSFATTYTTDWWSFFQTQTQYDRSFIPEEGQSPFFFDERDQLDLNQIRETATVYWDSPQKYKWSVSTGYDWNLEEQLDYKTEINVQPNAQFRTNLKTGFRIRQNIYDPLSLVSRYRARKDIDLSLFANYDLNAGELLFVSNTISSTLGGDNWVNRWWLKAQFTYQPQVNDTYQLQSLSLIKDLHRRKLTLTYNKLLEEYRLTFSINAFEDDSIGISTNKVESLKVEGVFDDQSMDR